MIAKEKLTKLIKIAGAVFLLIFLLEIWIGNQLSVYGNKIAELKQAKANLTLENQILENTIAQNSSLSYIEKKAQEFGFENIKNLEYIKFSEK